MIVRNPANLPQSANRDDSNPKTCEPPKDTAEQYVLSILTKIGTPVKVERNEVERERKRLRLCIFKSKT